MIWILYTSHNTLPPALESYFLRKLEAAAGSHPICSVIKNARTSAAANFGALRFVCSGGVFETNNWKSYLAQMKRGAEAIRAEDSAAVVCVAEHDVLYPANYFENEPANASEILKNFNVALLNARAFYPFETFLHSQTIARVSLFLHCLAEPVENQFKFKNEKAGRYTLRKFRNKTPVVDVRWGGNYTGGRAPRQTPSLDLEGYGSHAALWAEIESRLTPELRDRTRTSRWGG